MAQISTEQALQIPQQLKRHGSHSDSGHHTNQDAADGQTSRYLADETVTLNKQDNHQTNKNINLQNFKSELGQDHAFIKETLKNKLAEFNLNPQLQLTASKDMFGNLELKGALLQQDLEKITADLNKSQAFTDAFNRVQQQQPTLDYVDNVVKIADAYGVSNSLFNSIVSEDTAFNGLNDIAHRYQSLRGGPENYSATAQTGGNFTVTVN